MVLLLNLFEQHLLVVPIESCAKLLVCGAKNQADKTMTRLKSGSIVSHQPCLCLCFGFSQITLILPFLLMILHFSQIGLTDDLTFTVILLSVTVLSLGTASRLYAAVLDFGLTGNTRRRILPSKPGPRPKGRISPGASTKFA